MRDITERKHYIEQLRNLNAELEAASSHARPNYRRDVLIQESTIE